MQHDGADGKEEAGEDSGMEELERQREAHVQHCEERERARAAEVEDAEAHAAARQRHWDLGTSLNVAVHKGMRVQSARGWDGSTQNKAPYMF